MEATPDHAIGGASRSTRLPALEHDAARRYARSVIEGSAHTSSTDQSNHCHSTEEGQARRVESQPMVYDLVS